MKDFLYVMGVFFLVCSIISAPLISIAEFLSNRSCTKYEEITGKETKYVWFDTCYINTEAAGWVRYDEYRARMVASEGLNSLGNN